MFSTKRFFSLLTIIVGLLACNLSSLAVTVYFDNEKTNWSDPHCYYWDGKGHNNKWPGESMTLYQGTVWLFDIPDGNPNVIFNNGSDSQSDDLSVVENGVYTKEKYTGYTVYNYPGLTPPSPPTPQSFTVYFDNYESLWGQIHCYPYDANDTRLEVETTAMTRHNGSIWKYTVPADCNKVVFSDGGTVYTEKIDAVANRVYRLSGSTGKSISEWRTPILDDVYVYFSGDWSPLYIYIYDDSTSPTKIDQAWPGNPMTYDSASGMYAYKVPDDFKQNSKVIINTNGGSDRYPANNQPGMPLEGESMVFIADGNQWMEYSQFTPPSAGSTNLGKFVSYSDADGCITVTGTEGTLYITPWAPEIIKIFTLKKGASAVTERTSISVVDKNDPMIFYEIPEALYTVTESEDFLTVSVTDGVIVKVDKATMLLSFWQDGFRLLSESTGLVNAPAGGNTRIGFAPGIGQEAFYGGGYNGNWVNWNGKTMTMNNTQTGNWEQGSNPPHNICVPYYVSTNGYGVFFDSNFRKAQITPSTSGSSYSSKSTTPVAYYFIGGGTMERAMQNFNMLTGHQNLPPYWALGYITSKYSFATDDEARQTVTKTKAINIPIDGLVFDIHWQGGSRGAYGMGYLDWNTSAFPNKEGLVKDLLAQNVHSLAITEPFFNSAGDASTNYNLLKNRGWLADERVTANSNMNWIGGGANVGLIDASNPNAMAWFADQCIPHTRKGMSGWWLDLGEPEAYNTPGDETNTHHMGGTPDQVHNEFGNLWTAAVYNRLATAEESIDADVADGLQIKDLRHITLPRAGTAGMQRYGAFPWTGDIRRSWKGLAAQVPALVSASMSGIGYLGSDIGGFSATGTDADLYRRWVQLGVFYPMMRTHSATSPEVWQNDYASVRDDIRNAINLRYAYLPYLYNQSYAYTLNGTPIARPANFYDSDPTANANSLDSYLWGPDMFVAPVLSSSNSKSIRFPDGDWLDMNNFSTIHEGGSTWEGTVSESTIPHYMRRGSFIPRYRQDTYENTASIATNKLTIDYFPMYGGITNSGYFFDDDHRSVNTIRDGKYLLTHFSAVAHDSNSQNGIVIFMYQTGDGWDGMPDTYDMLFRIHDFKVTNASYGSDETLQSSDFGITTTAPANGPRRETAASAPFVKAGSLQDVLNAPDSQNTFAHVGNDLYLRVPKMPSRGNSFLSMGSEVIFTGIERPAALEAITLTYDGGAFTYSAPEGTEALNLSVYSATGVLVARVDGLHADGYAHQVSPAIGTGMYIVRLEGSNSAGARKAKTLKIAVR